MGADVETIRKGCILHDVGKVVTDEEGTHVTLGVLVCKKFGMPQEVINIVAEHHEDKPFSSAESVIVYTADAISGSRPGARYEPIEAYTSRMEGIEKIAREFSGVDKVFAFQAGREVQVIVNPKSVTDDDLINMAYDIARKLEKEVEYAGQIKVNVLRQTQASETTKAK